MSRSAFLALLTALVQGQSLTEAQAAVLLAAYDRRAFGRDAFPLLASETGYVATEALIADAASSYLAPGALGLDYDARRGLLNSALDTFGAEADRRTRLLFSTPEEAGAARRSAGSVRRWHLALREAVAEDLMAAARLGFGPGDLPPATLARLNAIIAEQQAYLSRFADEVAAHRMLVQEGVAVEARVAGRYTEKAIAARARSYQGAARSAFYAIGEAAEAERLGEGWVAEYEAVDDGGTCSPCLSAELNGPYLPSEGPMPGRECLGRGHCRCVRTLVYSPADYERITQTALAA